MEVYERKSYVCVTIAARNVVTGEEWLAQMQKGTDNWQN